MCVGLIELSYAGITQIRSQGSKNHHSLSQLVYQPS